MKAKESHKKLQEYTSITDFINKLNITGYTKLQDSEYEKLKKTINNNKIRYYRYSIDIDKAIGILFSDNEEELNNHINLLSEEI